MRARRGSPLLLLLLAAPTLSHALEVYSQDKSLESNLRRREAEPEALEKSGGSKHGAEPAPAAQESAAVKRWKGTENAPVDGFDGKPHTGPFVVNTPDDDAKDGSVTTTASKSRPTNLDKWTQAGSGEWKIDEIPEKNDGVMNDDNRIGPKKGTDGTAGGISEKEKERRLKGFAENKPQEPKEAPPLPHSEEEWLQEKEGKGGEKARAAKDGERSGTRVVDQTTREDNKFGKGGYGIDLPENLPEKPHKLPHPEPRAGSSPPSSASKEDGPPVAPGSPWLQDTMPYTESKKPKSVTKKQPDPVPPKSIDATFAELDSWHEWFHSFVLSFTMILASEIGDKTFLVAALMAMRHPRLLVFSAAFGALIVMTVLSAVLGHAFPTILPQRLTTFAAAVLFLVFGGKSLKEGLEMSKDSGVGDEMKEVEAELEEKEHTMARDRRRSSLSPYALESGRGRQQSFKLPKAEPSPPSSRSPTPDRNGGSSDRWAGLVNLCSLVFSPAWVQTFIMTFLGEWGDRSQIATIAMAAGQDYWWVTLGAITGHACCTGLAVLGGRALAGRVSMRVVTIGGAIAFLAFGVIYLFECLTESSP